MLRIGVDTGGTFTDFVVVDGDRVTTWKEPSTPDDPARAILAGISRALGATRLGGADLVHGSTVATNALLEGKVARIAFVTNSGFEDMLEIGRQARPDLYDLDVRRPEPLAPRDLRFGVDARVRADGSTSSPLTPGAIDALIEQVSASGVEAVAICLLHSYLDSTHEEEIARALVAAGHLVSVSSRLVPEYREYERASTTAVNAAVAPVVSRYLARLREGLPAGTANLRVMGSNGGALSMAAAAEEAVRTVLSGPAAGVRASYHVGLAVGRTRIISFDMGGTSTDVCLVPGAVRTTGEAVVAGHPVKIPTIDIHTVGAGGGSIAWRDAGGALRVGPASAGAVPGPAAYGHGGPPTVTDANLLLGRIVPERFLDGRMRLDPAASREAVRRLAASLGLSVTAAAEGILEVAEATMARAIRVISLQRGHEPADFDLMAFGGAGGLHAASLASTLGIERVIVPASPGVFSAFGMTVADVLKDRSSSLLAEATAATGPSLEDRFTELERACGGDLEAEGIDPRRRRFERTLDLRYRGQSFEINVPYGDGWIESFHDAHLRLYGYRRETTRVEIVALRVRGVGLVEPPPPPPPLSPGAALSGLEPPARKRGREDERRIVWGGREMTAAVVDRERLDPDAALRGPALIVESGATTLLPTGWRCRTDAMGHLHMTRDGTE